MTDFFTLEAGEYLERLDGALTGGAVPPPVDEMLKLSRALRGSALMANKGLIARAAAGLEALVRAVREGRRNWDAETQQITIRAVDDLKILIRSVLSWTDADSVKAEALSGELERLAGTPRTSGAVPRMDAPSLDAGARAFVAREGAAIASSLDRASQALRANPAGRDPLHQVTKALQPLRGLAALNDLPPLPDVLEGIERAIAELDRSEGAPPAGVDQLFQAAASAIAGAAREVAEQGRPDPEGANFKTFAAKLVAFLGSKEAEPGVVPIASLYYADDGPHVVKRGTFSARPATLGKLELVSHGEHLRQAADSLERAPSPTQRELRAHTLAGTFRALMNEGGGPLAAGVGEFAEAARDAVRDGTAVREAARFSAELRRAGDILTRSSTEEEETLATELADVTAKIRGLGASPVSPVPVVPIESLAPEPPAPAPASAPAPTLAPTPAPPVEDAIEETPDLVGTWALYERVTAGELGVASLDLLIAGATAVAPPPAAVRAAPAPPPAPAPRPAAVPTPAPAPVEPQVVDIRTLLYRGEAARRRAAELRAYARNVSGEELRALVDEVCDLVDLALDPS
jgi:chemotaxis protein histidine kinase CheA